MDEDRYKDRFIILFNVLLMTFMAVLDGSIINVALPVMAERLSVTTEAVSWVVTSYLAVITATILICGKLGDFYGKIKVFRIGVVGFTLGSLLCGVSESFAFLLAARVIQALGAAAAMATNQGIITQAFPANERGRALGLSGTVVALGSLAGPPLGGFIIAIIDWHYIFLINLPIGIIASILGAKYLKSNHERQGAVNTDRRLLPLDIFRNWLFSLSLLCAFFSFIAISCSNITLPFYLQNVLGYSPKTTGLVLMIYPMILVVTAPLSGYLSDLFGSEHFTFLGLLFTGFGLYLMSGLDESSGLPALASFIAVMSVGNGLFQSPNTSLVMSSVTPDRLGVAGSLNAFVRNTGMVFGVYLATSILYSRMSESLGYEVSDYVPGHEAAFIYGMKYVYLTAAVICGIGAALTAYRLYVNRYKQRQSAEINDTDI